MFVAGMNPKSGSFFVDPRMSRHFTLVGLSVPEKEILNTIYFQILDNHLSMFDDGCRKYASKIVNATQSVFVSLANSPQFMPTARKFHYAFNLRDMDNIIQGLLNAQPQYYKGNVLGLCRMWAHECHRVWLDRLLFEEDINMYNNFITTGLKEFSDFKGEDILAEPLIFTSFVTACKGHEAAYLNIESNDDLNRVLNDKLEEYNENVAAMDLVLFQQAMEHVTRIARIIDLPCGNALLVGVGGSGKQSLSKLSAFILGYDVFRIVVSTNYGLNDLKADI